MARPVEQRRHRRALHDPARVHDQHVVGELGNDPQVVRDQKDRHVQPLLQIAQQLENLRLRRHVECGGRLVGDQELGAAAQCNGDHHALPHAAGEFVRIGAHDLAGRGNTHERQQFLCPHARRRSGEAELDPKRLHHLVADGEDRVQRCHRILEDHGDFASADGLHLPLAQALEVTPAKPDASRRQSRRLRQQLHEGHRGYALAAAGFADDSHSSTRPNLEAHVPHGIERSLSHIEGDGEIPY